MSMKALRFGIIGWGIQATTQVGDIFCSDIDAVVLATPVRTHFQLAREALLHDKHVLVEKLLTNSVAQAEELIAQPRAHGGVGL
jgi:predicted dehydrogenase